MDFSPVCVRLPHQITPEQVTELREQFPNIEVRLGGVDRIIVGSEENSALAAEVYHWTREHFHAA